MAGMPLSSLRRTWMCKCRVRQEPLAAMDVFTAFSGRNDLCRLVNYSTIIVKYVPFRSEPEYYALNEKNQFYHGIAGELLSETIVSDP